MAVIKAFRMFGGNIQRNAECGEQISRIQEQLRNLEESFAFRWFSWALPEAPRFEECAVAAPPDSFLGRWMKRLPIVGGYLKASEEVQRCELALGQMEKAAETFNDQLKSNWFLRKILPEFDLGTQVDNQVVSQGNGKFVLMGAAAFVALAGGIYWAFGRKSSSDEVGTEDNISSEEDCIGNEALQTEEIIDGVGFEEINDEDCTDEDNLSKEEENIDIEEDLQSKEIIDGKSEEKDKSQLEIIISESVQEMENENVRSEEDGTDKKLQSQEIIDGKSEEKDKSQQEIIISESVQEMENENVRSEEDGTDKELQCEETPEASCVETAEEDLAAEKRVEEKTLERVGPNLYEFKVSKLEWQILNGRQRRIDELQEKLNKRDLEIRESDDLSKKLEEQTEAAEEERPVTRRNVLESEMDRCIHKQDFESALVFLRVVLEDFDDVTQCHAKEIRCLMALGRWDEAQNVLDELADEHKENSDVKVEYAILCASQYNFEEAERILEDVLKVCPNHPRALEGREFLQRQVLWNTIPSLIDNSEFEVVLETISRCQKLESFFPWARAELLQLKGNILCKLRRLEEARECFLSALAIDETDVDSRLKLGLCYLLGGKYRDAIALFEQLDEEEQLEEDLVFYAEALERMERTGCPFQTIGVKTDASQKEIEKAYRKMALKYHPDKCHGSDIDQRELHEIMQRINYAKDLLTDNEMRKEYDEVRKFVEDFAEQLFENPKMQEWLDEDESDEDEWDEDEWDEDESEEEYDYDVYEEYSFSSTDDYQNLINPMYGLNSDDVYRILNDEDKMFMEYSYEEYSSYEEEGEFDEEEGEFDEEEEEFDEEEEEFEEFDEEEEEFVEEEEEFVEEEEEFVEEGEEFDEEEEEFVEEEEEFDEEEEEFVEEGEEFDEEEGRIRRRRGKNSTKKRKQLKRKDQ
ncbi:golgin subfamily A member 6-like protein 25 [Palaemon carinicauda]|uniref:golgin subfamily A member 6-like protein 25 n=1 Tax=Palaemon carinicauda TaxID=392227 RepID=UPI0035B57C66